MKLDRKEGRKDRKQASKQASKPGVVVYFCNSSYSVAGAGGLQGQAKLKSCLKNKIQTKGLETWLKL
jgi:hypothetical protein